MSASFERERQIAELAVQRAVLLTKTVLASMDKGAVSKADYTPVTLADFGGQALLVAAITAWRDQAAKLFARERHGGLQWLGALAARVSNGLDAVTSGPARRICPQDQ